MRISDSAWSHLSPLLLLNTARIKLLDLPQPVGSIADLLHDSREPGNQAWITSDKPKCA